MTAVDNVSQRGTDVLAHDEGGHVLRAYRCPAGVLTIGPGITSLSGVFRVTAGMTITLEQSRRMFREVLDQVFVPRCRRAGLTRTQHEMDGSVSFDYNTGAVDRASWVQRWLTGQRADAERRFKQWNKGGGKVLRGLELRRDREWNLIANGVYPSVPTSSSPGVAVSTDASAVREYQEQLIKLGYDLGPAGADGTPGSRTEAAVRAFQRRAGLTVDGIVGPATRAALVRALDARSQNRQTATGGGAGAGAGGGADVATQGEVGMRTLETALLIGAGVALAVLAAWLVWRYRGPLFAWLPERAKDALERVGIVVGRRIPT